jgi:hypothetical protein
MRKLNKKQRGGSVPEGFTPGPKPSSPSAYKKPKPSFNGIKNTMNKAVAMSKNNVQTKKTGGSIKKKK